MRIKIAKLYISPVVFHGYVEIKKESLLEMESAVRSSDFPRQISLPQPYNLLDDY